MRILKAILFVLLFSAVAAAQGKTHLVRSTTSLPATCNPGNGVTPTDEVDLVSGGTTKHYVCSSTNTWTPLGGGGTTVSTVTPEQYGAKGDGVTDDTAALQAAINACSGAGLGYMTAESSTPPSGYCTVVLGQKVYLVSSALTIAASQVHIQGQGMRASIIMSNSTTADILDITGSAYTSSGAAAWDYLSDFAVMRNVTPVANAAGIRFQLAIFNYVYRVESWDSYYDFAFTSVNVGHINFYDVNALYTLNVVGSVGFYFATSMNSSRCTSCIVSGAGTNITGFYFHGAADVFLDRCEVAGSGVAFYFDNSSYDIIVTSPIVEGGSGSIRAVGNNPTAAGIEFVNGYYHSGSNAPIWISNSSQVSIIGGQVGCGNGLACVLFDTGSHDNLASGLQMLVGGGTNTASPAVINGASGGATRNVISNNNISAPVGTPGNTGIYLWNGTTYNTITGNTIGGYFLNGIFTDSTSNNNIFIGNSIDPTHITTPVSNAGAGNTIFNGQGGLLVGGTAAVLTGTGACATRSTQSGNSSTGQITCTGTTGASTLTITPGFTAANGMACFASDLTHTLVGSQSSGSTTACTITFSSVTASDVITFGVSPY